jgi:ABC-type antimicrobial peptide transport system permease subunit
MNALAQIALRSLWHFRRINLALALGVAAATAVLTGALIVGDSMRGSLRQLAIERLGDIDDLILSDSFFSANLASKIQGLPDFQKSYRAAEPAIFFPGGSVEWQQEMPRRAGQVAVLGINPRFWDFANPTWKPQRNLDGDSVMINQALADQLGLTQVDVSGGKAKLTVRIPKQHRLPADSPMSKQDDLIESLVDLKVAEIVPNHGLGGFSLFPSQTDPLNVYLSLERLQESLEQTVLKHKSDPEQANLIMLAGKHGVTPEVTSEQLLHQAQPGLEDFGLSLKQIRRTYRASSTEQETVFDYASLTTDRLVFNDLSAEAILGLWPEAKPVFTYLANDIRMAQTESEPGRKAQNGIPFSMVTAIDFGDSFQPRSRETAQAIAALADDEIVLVEWAAEDLGAQVGDLLELSYFEPETTHGDQVERTIKLKLADIATLTKPDSGYQVSRRGGVQSAQFSQRPQITNDPDLTPEVPGVTDAESIERWDLPFETASKIRPQDDQYWNDHRTTPKAFVSLALGQRLWDSRFGKITSFRLPAKYVGLQPELVSKVAQSAEKFGLQSLSIKQRSLDASAGSTPFDILFLALSMFVIGSALILVALLFRLNVQHRASEVGILSALGWEHASLRWLWLAEMSLIAVIGATLGVILGIGYAWLMIWGLSTWWVDAISSPFLKMHLNPLPIGIGWISGWLVSTLTIAWTLKRALRQNTLNLLKGELESPRHVGPSTGARSMDSLLIPIFGCGLVGLGLTWFATKLTGEGQAGAFLGSGFCILIAGLLATYRAFHGRPLVSQDKAELQGLNLFKLAQMNANRNPLRSTLTVGLVAIASFLIAAVSAFRLAPTEQGTGGFEWVAKSSQPVLLDLSSAEGRARLLGVETQLSSELTVLPLRYQPGEDASCNNLYQSTNPQILGLPQTFLDSSNSAIADPQIQSFAWASSLASSETEKQNPWLLLRSDSVHTGTAEDPIPTVIDKNTANYSLKIYTLNSTFKVQYERGETLHFRVVGFLANTILQGSLLVSERDFVTAFPSVGGYQYFLIREVAGQNAPVDSRVDQTRSVTSSKPEELLLLEARLSDYGFEARSARQILVNFLKVQNTYLNTFQTLGSLGLLLGTFGLAVVQLRAIFERRREFGLLRAVGFSESQLRRLVLWENFLLLGLGLGIGIGAALFTTIPHRWLGNAAIPWVELGAMFGAIALVGLLASHLASSKLNRLPLLESLRN